MPVTNERIIDEFWEICNATYKAWLARRSLFEDNDGIEVLMGTHCGPFLDHLNEVTQLHLFSRLVTLHDPPKQQGHTNLSIAFVIDSGTWDAATATRLNELKAKLDSFASHIQVLRNKLIAHTDHATFRSRKPLSAFPLDADIEYFANLQEFVDTLEGGDPNPFDNLIRNDAQVFVEALLRGSKPVNI